MIKFKHDETGTAASRDIRIFRKWELGEIDAFDAAYEIAVNNDLNHVSEKEFIETAHGLGYWREWEYDGEE